MDVGEMMDPHIDHSRAIVREHQMMMTTRWISGFLPLTIETWWRLAVSFCCKDV
jgi:hypothetical protein